MAIAKRKPPPKNKPPPSDKLLPATEHTSEALLRDRFSRRCLTRPLLAFLAAFVFSSAAESSCTAQNADTRQRVVYVHDGDTLWLEDGSKVRVIGLNAPEVASRYDSRSRSEPFAEAARDALRERLMGRDVLLDFDEQKLDRYKRLLAHVFFVDGDSVTAWMLAKGLAQASPVKPNFKYIDCYAQADQEARSKRLGLWSHPRFAPRPAAELRREDGGFMLVCGCVISLRSEDRYRYAYLSARFRLKLDKSLPEAQKGQCLTARGWVYNDRYYPGKGMSVSHPSAIENTHAESEQCRI